MRSGLTKWVSIMANKIPELICITGVDGSGKTSLTNWLIENLSDQGYKVESIWSRFNNYLSKPLLAVTRLTGHNHRSSIDGVKYGFHDFKKLYVYRELFALLQGFDTNIAAYFKITKQKPTVDCLVCERSPWDTLVDVIVDTGLEKFIYKWMSGLYLNQVRGKSLVLFIDRDYEKIITCRPELVHDYKMKEKIESYRNMAVKEDWIVINNNDSLESTKKQILENLHYHQNTQILYNC